VSAGAYFAYMQINNMHIMILCHWNKYIIFDKYGMPKRTMDEIIRHEMLLLECRPKAVQRNIPKNKLHIKASLRHPNIKANRNITAYLLSPRYNTSKPYFISSYLS
jgi:hypothetical protein